ncbi:MAG: segregation and condensation protein A [Actinomycetota bacterium]
MTESREEYLIEYDKYRGPIKVLLELVQSKKADIYQISLNEVISGFLEFIKRSRTVTIDTISSFIWTASILLEIKSRSLLPSKKKEVQEEEPDEAILRRREKEYRVFKKISSFLQKAMETEELFLVREAPLEKEFMDTMPDFLEGINSYGLSRLAARVLKGQPEQMNLGIVYNHRNIRSIYDEMERVKQKLETNTKMTFRDLTVEYEQIIDIIICFLSILELYKNEEIEIVQFENFGSITVKKMEENGQRLQ